MPYREGPISLQQAVMGGLCPGLVVVGVEEEVGNGVAGNPGVSLSGILFVNHIWGAWEISSGKVSL